MQKVRKLYTVLGVSLLLIFLSLLFLLHQHHAHHTEESFLYQTVQAYYTGEQPWAIPADADFAEDAGEALFLRGMTAFSNGRYEIAKNLFENALEAKSSDPALPGYLYYYINQCLYEQTAAGDSSTVAKALEAFSKYTPLANNTDLLWDLISSISLSSDTDQNTILLLQTYLETAKHPDLVTWAWVKNCMAMLEYNNRKYAKSIRNFYDVQLMLEDADRTPELDNELRYAKEYIANIYFTFEYYEKAAALYQELIDDFSKEDSFHAYGCCINMASAYLETSDTERARQAVQILQDNLSRVEPDAVPEVQACIHDILANIYIKEGDFAKADSYLVQAEAYYEENIGTVFFGGQYFITLSRCQYWVKNGELYKAQAVLEQMEADGTAAYYGLEQEIYDLLKEIYQKTGQDKKLIGIYEQMFALDEQFTKTLEREYLEFTEYYQENTLLREHNSRLSHTNFIAIFSIVLISGVLVMILFLLRFLSTKNVTDQLTGVYNRKKLNGLLRTYKRTGTPGNLGVVMMDVDYFKRYNDTYGHPAGDAILKEVASVLSNSVRSKDLVIRYGGEEFLLLLNGVKAQTAEAICQRIHDQLRDRALPHQASEVSDFITLSMGLCYQEDSNQAPLEKLIEAADQCLYQSKEAGRNRVTVSEWQ